MELERSRSAHLKMKPFKDGSEGVSLDRYPDRIDRAQGDVHLKVNWERSKSWVQESTWGGSSARQGPM